MRKIIAIASSVFALVLRKARRAPGTGPSWPSPQRLAIAATAIVMALLLAHLWLDPVAIIDPHPLPFWIRHWIGNFSAFGKSGWLLWPTATLLVASLVAGYLARWPKDRLVFVAFGARLLFLFCSLALPGLVVGLVKPLFGRVRPFANGTFDPSNFQPLALFRDWSGSVPVPEFVYGSMPSGHATNAFAFAVALGALLPRLRVLLLALAVAVAASRLAIGVHHFTDVMVGALIGIVGALTIRNLFAARRLVFAVGPAGNVYAMPGPSLRRLGAAIERLFSQSRPAVAPRNLAPEPDR